VDIGMEKSKDTKSERFAQILAPSNTVPETIFGELILRQDSYAVSYEDSSRKIPEWARLRLSPHDSTDMYGTPCASYMVRLKEKEKGPRAELDHLADRYEKSDLIIGAVHDVHHISEQGQSNNKSGSLLFLSGCNNENSGEFGSFS
jgi:hypothetical protein